jgi:hypothetical protein
MFEIAQFSQKYQTMTRAHSRGAQDGNHNLPPANATRPSQTELEIIQLAQDDIARFSNRQVEENDQTMEKLRSWYSQLSKSAPPSIDTFGSQADLKFNEAERELLRLYDNVLSRQQEYRYFKTVNRLNRDADIPSPLYVTVCWLIFIIVLDGALNAYFFKDTNPYGLVGGFLFAILISGANTLLGFGAGLIPWRYLQHRKRLHLVWAFPLLVFFLSVICSFNLAVGHYRDLLAINKDALPQQAIGQLIVSPLGLQSIQSFLLTGLGIAIAMLAAHKGYTFIDPYPGYGRCYIRRENAKDLFEDRFTALERAINVIANQFLDQAKAQYQRTNKIVQDAIGAAQEAISRNEKYAENFEGIEKACDAAVRVYRDANMQVRDRARYPEPRYFSEFVTLSRPKDGVDLNSFQTKRDKLVALDEEMKTEFAALSQSIPVQAKQMLSELALNERLEKIKETAKRNRQEEVEAASADS